MVGMEGEDSSTSAASTPKEVKSPPSRARVSSFMERRLAPIRSDNVMSPATSSPRRNTMRDALRRSVSNVKYGSFLETLKQAEEQAKLTREAREGEPNVSSFKRSSFLSVSRDEGKTPSSFRQEDEVTGDVYVLGTLIGAELTANSTLNGFGKSLWCEWLVVNNEKWSLVRGRKQGATHKVVVASSLECDDGMHVWQNPLELQLRSTTSFDWPKLCFTLFEHNSLMSTDSVFGYGLASLQLTPGYHALEVQCWRPATHIKCSDSEVGVLFTGLRPEFESKNLVWEREGPYMNMQTVGIGKIKLQLNVVFSKEMEDIIDMELTDAEADSFKENRRFSGVGGARDRGSGSEQEEDLSEGLKIVRSRRSKRFNEVTSSLVAANMLRSKFDSPKPSSRVKAFGSGAGATPGTSSSPFVSRTPASAAGAGVAAGAAATPDAALTPADKARADRRQRMQALMQERELKRAERAAQRKVDEQG